MKTAVLMVLALFAGSAYAHKASDSYLTLRVAEAAVEGQWDIALRDLDLALDLDADGNGEISWGEVRSRHGAIAEYALGRLALKRGDKPCELRSTAHLVDEHTDGAYAVLRFSGTCAATGPLTVAYRLLFDVDAQHRGLLKLEGLGEARSAVLSAGDRERTFDPASGNTAADFGTFVADGMKHIAIGIDHILFLVALLLPAVMVRVGRRWRPASSLGATLLNVTGIVTAFTLAHSITLALAALGYVSLPSRLVESAIAVTVVTTAADNLWPFLPRQRWRVAFGFGLLHGFGFASVLVDLGLPAGSLALSLLGFNLGVELGQLALVLLLVPLAHALRARPAYPRYVVGAGSTVIALVALGWVAERALGIALMPF